MWNLVRGVWRTPGVRQFVSAVLVILAELIVTTL